MKFTDEIIINKNRKDVWKAYNSIENLYKWQPTLKKFTHLSGKPGQPGAKSKLVYKENKREIEIILTLTNISEPEIFAGDYDFKGARNAITNSFIEIEKNKTKWIMETELKFGGVYKILSPLLKGMMIKRTRSNMNRFKNLAERNLE